jgi:hypothetical protein
MKEIMKWRSESAKEMWHQLSIENNRRKKQAVESPAKRREKNIMASIMANGIVINGNGRKQWRSLGSGNGNRRKERNENVENNRHRRRVIIAA